jgi:DNA-binding MarR family transcriptional regulator
MAKAPNELNPNELNPNWLSPREMRAWRSYIIASRRLLEALDQDLEGHDLSMPDYEVLAQLSEAPGRKLRMSELAEISMISKSRLSHRIKVMESSGLVRREACKEDKRGSWAIMTDKGLKAIVRAAPDHLASVRGRFVDQLNAKEQEMLSIAFERVLKSLRADFKRDEL